jgi:hypothetical protein
MDGISVKLMEILFILNETQLNKVKKDAELEISRAFPCINRKG